MHRAFIAAVAGGLAAALAGSAGASAPPVGPLPSGPVKTVKLARGKTFSVSLPKPAAGRSWRIARAFNGKVVTEVVEATTANGGVQVVFRATGTGKTRVVFALTLGERAPTPMRRGAST